MSDTPYRQPGKQAQPTGEAMTEPIITTPMPYDPVRKDIATLALLNPQLALWLARGQRREPRVYTMAFIWDTSQEPTGPSDIQPGTQLAKITNRFVEVFYQDAYILGLYYTLRGPLPNGEFPEFEAQLNAHRNENPYVSVDMRIEGPDRREITNLGDRGADVRLAYPVPLETVATTRKDERNLMNRAQVILQNQNLVVDAYVDRVIRIAEQPFRLWMTLTVEELSGCNLRAIKHQDAVCQLRNMGLYPDPSALAPVPCRPEPLEP